MTKKKRLIIYFLVLIVILVLGMVMLFSLFGSSGEENYKGVNIEKSVELGEYKNLTMQFPEGSAEDFIKRNIFNNVVISAQVEKYPDKAVKKFVEENEQYYTVMAEDYGYDSLEEYVTQSMGYSMEEFQKYIDEYAKSKVKAELVAYAIAEAEGIEVTDKQLEEYCKELLKEEGFTEDSFAEIYGMPIDEYAEKNNFKLQLLQEKVLDFLYESTTIELV